MKKKIMKIALAIAFLVMPTVCSAQGLLINSTGMLPWKPVPENNQSNNQSNTQNNPFSGGFLVDDTYYIDENGNKIYYGLDSGSTLNSSSTRRSSSSSSSSRTCGRCGGNGGCPTCGNTGKMLNTMYGGRTYSTCSSCHGRKVCPSCGR